MEPKVIFEDSQILVLDKPAGMVVNRARSVRGKTVQDWVERKLKVKSEKLKVDKESDFFRRSGVVHRLDKETSGLLLVAKTPEAFQNLQRQFKKRRVEKRYLGLVHGRLTPREGEVTASISRSPYDRKKFGVFLGGRRAKTAYQVLGTYRSSSGEEYSLVEFSPETGRTHQIRVHAKHLGHPLLADPIYAGRRRARTDRLWCPRLFLHASKISFGHPETRKKVDFSSTFPADLEEALRSLQSSA